MHPAGLPPADSPFEAEHDCNFTTDAEMVGCLGLAPSSRRLRAGTSLSKFATLMAVCEDRDTKAELNHRSQCCEVLAVTGISRRLKWSGMSVARRLFRFGRPACISQHLCPVEWNPVRESHSLGWFCRPLPGLFGQRDMKLKCERKLSPPPALSFSATSLGCGFGLCRLERHEAARHTEHEGVTCVLCRRQ